MSASVSASSAASVELEVVGLHLKAGGSARGRNLFGPLDLRIGGGQRWVVIGPNGGIYMHGTLLGDGSVMLDGVPVMGAPRAMR